MKNITNILIVVVAALIIGLYFKQTIVNHYSSQVVGAAVGDVNQTPRMWQQTISLATTTPLSLTNSSGGERLITSVELYIASSSQTLSNATGLANLVFTMSTSTDAFTAASSNYVLNTTIATSSGPVYVATSTPGNAAVVSTRIWGNGTNLNLFQNGTSTSSGVVVIIHYRQF